MWTFTLQFLLGHAPVRRLQDSQVASRLLEPLEKAGRWKVSHWPSDKSWACKADNFCGMRRMISWFHPYWIFSGSQGSTFDVWSCADERLLHRPSSQVSLRLAILARWPRRLRCCLTVRLPVGASLPKPIWNLIILLILCAKLFSFFLTDVNIHIAILAGECPCSNVRKLQDSQVASPLLEPLEKAGRWKVSHWPNDKSWACKADNFCGMRRMISWFHPYWIFSGSQGSTFDVWSCADERLLHRPSSQVSLRLAILARWPRRLRCRLTVRLPVGASLPKPIWNLIILLILCAKLFSFFLTDVNIHIAILAGECPCSKIAGLASGITFVGTTGEGWTMKSEPLTKWQILSVQSRQFLWHEKDDFMISSVLDLLW